MAAHRHRHRGELLGGGPELVHVAARRHGVVAHQRVAPQGVVDGRPRHEAASAPAPGAQSAPHLRQLDAAVGDEHHLGRSALHRVGGVLHEHLERRPPRVGLVEVDGVEYVVHCCGRPRLVGLAPGPVPARRWRLRGAAVRSAQRNAAPRRAPVSGRRPRRPPGSSRTPLSPGRHRAGSRSSGFHRRRRPRPPRCPRRWHPWPTSRPVRCRDPTGRTEARDGCTGSPPGG